jgi:hypothetical protein
MGNYRKMLAVAMGLAFGYLFARNAPDIARYIKISTM